MKKKRAKTVRSMQKVVLQDDGVVIRATRVPSTATFLYDFLEGRYFDRVGQSNVFQLRKAKS